MSTAFVGVHITVLVRIVLGGRHESCYLARASTGCAVRTLYDVDMDADTVTDVRSDESTSSLPRPL